ncbi:MAG: CBS domain-containing protein [Kosmotogaceae bacterium]|nr:CBS domain-containing protein [Kosmotogaceae bacterium]
MENSERFMHAFRSIEGYLSRFNEDYRIDGFSRSLRDLSKSDKVLRNFLDMLLEFAELRNAIVHTVTEDAKPIAEPHDEVVQEIERIARMLNDPPKVASVFGYEKVATIDVKDSLEKALSIIAEKSYSQIPVYDGGKFMGILTTNTIARWMAGTHEEERTNSRKTRVREVMEYAEEDETVKFVSRKANLFDIVASFGEFSGLGKRLEAIIVTENGRRSETPLHIITIWDVPTIFAVLQK